MTGEHSLQAARYTGLTGLVAIALLLAGCVSSPAPPPPGTQSAPPVSESAGPEITPLVTGLSIVERSDAVAKCLQEKGWPAVHEEGRDYYETEYAEAQADAYLADETECLALYQGPPEPEITDEYIARIYQKQLATAECLEGLGADVPEPPSPQVYRDTFSSDKQWTAYGATQMSPTEFKKFSLTCPQPDGS